MSLAKRVIRAVTLRKFRKARRERSLLRNALREISRFPRHPNAARHQLPADLIISLTSYPARFPTLHLTIKSLLDQTARPDQIVLWIAHDDLAALPESVTSLKNQQFVVRTCDDMRSFKKIVPSLRAYPDSFILIADDDAHYPANWLEGLAQAYDPQDPTIVYYRGHRLTYCPGGSMAPYRSWQREVSDARSLLPSIDIMPTGVGGVLYPPGSLPPQTRDISLIRQLSETCDDSWLFFMWRGNGWKAKRAPSAMSKLVTWPNTQEESLMSFHRGGRKDEHLHALSEYFGTP